ncbi:MAG: FG-GAP repeat protein [Xanthomonadales bacterium]|nr:FG-GAP repeat protein [Xanthomonadales bacterium]
MRKFVLLFLSFPLMAQDWSVVENMAPSAAETSDFGVNMVFADDYLVVSWPRAFVDGLAATTTPDSCGEVITYEKVAGKYEPIATLTAADLTGSCVEGDGFGYGLAFDNGRLAIGMPAGFRAGMNLSGGGTDAGSRVFLTHFENGNWVLDETLTADDLGNGRGMGGQLVLEGDVLLVHAHEYDSIFGFSFIVSTGVYVFEDSGSGFSQTQKLSENFHLFGQDFDYENGQIVVGAWGEQTLNAAGRVYVYEKQGGNWSLSQTINDSRNSNLGNQIEIDGTTMAVGAVQAGGTGSVSIFENNGGQWQETQMIQADDARFNDQFAITVRIKGDDLLVGATGATSNDPSVGAVYHFVRQTNGDFVQQQKIESFEPNEGNDQFGGNLIFNDTDLLVNETSGGTLVGASTEFMHYSRAGNGNPDPDPVTTYDVNSKSSGVWQVVDALEHTISLQVMPDERVLMYGKTNADGNPLWLLGVGSYQDNVIDFPSIYTTSGGQFGAAFNPANVQMTVVGSAMVSFNACDAGELMFDLSGLGTSSVNIVKSIEIPGNECGNSNKILPNGISGSWFDPTRVGEGYTVYMFEGGGTQQAEVTWYTYDENGGQLVFSGVGSVNGQTIDVPVLSSLRGAELFSGSTGVSQLEMGSLSMTWDECRVAEVSYDLTLSGLGTGSMQVHQLSSIDNTDCGTLTNR